MAEFLPPAVTIGDNPPERLPERYLGFGPEGSGKTQAWLSIANMCHQVGSPAKFYVADSDAAVKRSMSNTFSHLNNVIVYDINEFRDYLTFAQTIMPEVKEGDWAVVDTASAGYELVQEYFFEARYGMSRQELEWERLFDSNWKEGKPLVEPEDWINIRNGFLNWWVRMMVRQISVKNNVNLFATAEAKQVFEHFDGKAKDKSTWLTYKELGFRPAGHQSMPHKVNTVAMHRRMANGFWINPTKDRERPGKTTDELLAHMKINDFAVDYLMGRCGWEVVG